MMRTNTKAEEGIQNTITSLILKPNENKGTNTVSNIQRKRKRGEN